MSTTANDFFTDVKDWSKRKLEIIEKYLDGFSTILKSYNTLYYIDGFAGKGIYSDGVKGSPVRAAELAINKYPGVLRCINVEYDPDNYSDLEKHTAQFGPIVQNYSGKFSDKADDILNKVSNSPCLFFLDDFGVKGSDWNTVKKVLSRQCKTDVWIRFDHKTIRRLDGCFESSGKGSAQKVARLSEHFGITDPKMLHSLLDGATPEDRIQNAIKVYQIQLERELGKDGFVGFYPIISLDGQNKYHLLFACRNPKAAVLANDVINGIEESFVREQTDYLENKRFEQTQQQRLLLFDPTPEEIFQGKVSRLKPLILSALVNGDMSVYSLRYSILKSNQEMFGRVRQKHFTAALKELQSAGKIIVEGAPSKNETILKLAN